MAYFLIAGALIVTFIGAGYVGLSLINRCAAGDGNNAAAERRFAVIFFWLGLLFIGWNIIDPLTALAYRLHEIRPMVQDCRKAGTAETCQKLARIYRDGYVGNCASEPTNRWSRSCTMVAKDAEKAAEFTPSPARPDMAKAALSPRPRAAATPPCKASGNGVGKDPCRVATTLWSNTR